MELAAAIRCFESPQQPAAIAFAHLRSPTNGLPMLGTIEQAMAEQFCEPIKKLCKICGDKAAYHNYGVLTCDSCKTFFRRQIIDKKPLKCHFNNRCKIDIKSRKDCSKCRLAKCVAVGMRQELIGSAEEERRKKQRISTQIYPSATGSAYGSTSSFAANLMQLTSTGAASSATMGREPIFQSSASSSSTSHHHHQQQQQQQQQLSATSRQPSSGSMLNDPQLNPIAELSGFRPETSALSTATSTSRRSLNEQTMIESIRDLNTWAAALGGSLGQSGLSQAMGQSLLRPGLSMSSASATASSSSSSSAGGIINPITQYSSSESRPIYDQFSFGSPRQNPPLSQSQQLSRQQLQQQQQQQTSNIPAPTDNLSLLFGSGYGSTSRHDSSSLANPRDQDTHRTYRSSSEQSWLRRSSRMNHASGLSTPSSVSANLRMSGSQRSASLATTGDRNNNQPTFGNLNYNADMDTAHSHSSSTSDISIGGGSPMIVPSTSGLGSGSSSSSSSAIITASTGIGYFTEMFDISHDSSGRSSSSGSGLSTSGVSGKPYPRSVSPPQLSPQHPNFHQHQQRQQFQQQHLHHQQPSPQQHSYSQQQSLLLSPQRHHHHHHHLQQHRHQQQQSNLLEKQSMFFGNTSNPSSASPSTALGTVGSSGVAGLFGTSGQPSSATQQSAAPSSPTFGGDSQAFVGSSLRGDYSMTNLYHVETGVSSTRAESSASSASGTLLPSISSIFPQSSSASGSPVQQTSRPSSLDLSIADQQHHQEQQFQLQQQGAFTPERLSQQSTQSLLTTPSGQLMFSPNTTASLIKKSPNTIGAASSLTAVVTTAARLVSSEIGNVYSETSSSIAARSFGGSSNRSATNIPSSTTSTNVHFNVSPAISNLSRQRLAAYDAGHLSREALYRVHSPMIEHQLAPSEALDQILGQQPQLGQEEFLSTLDQMGEELKMFTGFEEDDFLSFVQQQASQSLFRDSGQQLSSPAATPPPRSSSPRSSSHSTAAAEAASTSSSSQTGQETNPTSKAGDENFDPADEPVDEATLQALVNTYLAGTCNAAVVHRLYRIGRQMLNQLRRKGQIRLIRRSPKSIMASGENHGPEEESENQDPLQKLKQPVGIQLLDHVLFGRFIRDSIAPRCFQLGKELFLATMAAHMYRGHLSRNAARLKALRGEKLSESELAVLSSSLCLGQELIRPAHENETFIRPLVTTFQLPKSLTLLVLPPRKRPRPVDFSATSAAEQRLRRAEIRRQLQRNSSLQKKFATVKEDDGDEFEEAVDDDDDEDDDGDDENMDISSKERISNSRPMRIGKSFVDSDEEKEDEEEIEEDEEEEEEESLRSAFTIRSFRNSASREHNQLSHSRLVKIAEQVKRSLKIVQDERETKNEKGDDGHYYHHHHHRHRHGIKSEQEQKKKHVKKRSPSFGQLISSNDDDDHEDEKLRREDSEQEMSLSEQEQDENDNKQNDMQVAIPMGKECKRKSIFRLKNTDEKFASAADDSSSYGSVVTIPRVRDRFSRLRYYNSKESLRIGDITVAARRIISGDMKDLDKWMPNVKLEGPIKLQTYGVFKFILAFKALPSFNNFLPHDQKLLLRSCCSQLLLLRSTKHFDKDKLCWNIEPSEFISKPFNDQGEKMQLSFDPTEFIARPADDQGEKVQLSFDVMSHSPKPLLGLHARYLDFLEQLEPQWKQDDVLMTLLFAVVLFSSDHTSIKNISQVRVEYFCYVNILRRYLEATRSTYEDACREYSRLLCILEILRSLRELFESCSINFDASERMMDEFLFNNKDDDTSPSHLIIT